MTTAFAIRTVIEIIAILFAVYGILHEKKLIAFENKLAGIIAKKIYISRRRKAIAKKRANEKVKRNSSCRDNRRDRQNVIRMRNVA